MSNNKSDKGYIDGILGGLTVSLFNHFFQQRDKTLVDWDDIEYLEPFSYSELRKRQGYKLKYDIDESKIMPKIVNLFQVNKYSYKFTIANERLKGVINSSAPESYWSIVKSSLNNMVNEIRESGVFVLENTVPKFWVYGIKETDDFVKIIISDEELEQYQYDEKYNSKVAVFIDCYICLDLDEARDLANEMKRYYHNYTERVLILEEFDYSLELDNIYDKNRILDIIPNYYEILDVVRDLNTLKYKDISKFLYGIKYDHPVNILYTFYSLGIQLYQDNRYIYASNIFESILKVDGIILTESGLEYITRRNLLDIYIELKDQRKVINLLKYNFKGDYYIIQKARRLYDLELFDSAKVAYKIYIGNANPLSYDSYLFEAFLRTEDDKGMEMWRDKLIEENMDTFLIDRHLSDMNVEGLSVKINRFEMNTDWEQVISYCNKYIKLTIDNKWGKIDEVLIYELKKVNAFIQLNKFSEAWIASCKSRRTLISNFNGVEYLDNLSKVEKYMADICLKRDYHMDTIYHYILKIIYNDVFELYSNQDNGLPVWNGNLFLEDIIKKGNLTEWWLKVEPIIKNEYKDLSGKSPRTISVLILNTFREFNYKIILNEPKRYFPTTISIDFSI